MFAYNFELIHNNNKNNYNNTAPPTRFTDVRHLIVTVIIVPLIQVTTIDLDTEERRVCWISGYPVVEQHVTICAHIPSINTHLHNLLIALIWLVVWSFFFIYPIKVYIIKKNWKAIIFLFKTTRFSFTFLSFQSSVVNAAYYVIINALV